MSNQTNDTITNERGIFSIIIDYAMDLAYILLPLIGYFHQFFKIRSLKNSQGFSKFVSFILITAFTLRIFFWCGDHFEKSILIQCATGVIMQLLLLYECVKFDKSLIDKRFTSKFYSIKEFWNWPYFNDYFYFVCYFCLLFGFINNFIGYDSSFYVFMIGLISSIIEAFLASPQIYELYVTKNPMTISYLLVFSWIVGDIFKFIYYVSRVTPIQLKICAILQLSIDIVVVIQIFYYRRLMKKKANEQSEVSNVEIKDKEEGNDKDINQSGRKFKDEV